MTSLIPFTRDGASVADQPSPLSSVSGDGFQASPAINQNTQEVPSYSLCSEPRPPLTFSVLGWPPSLPLPLRLPSQTVAAGTMLEGEFRRVCPSHPHFLPLIWTSTSPWSAVLHSSSFVTLSRLPPVPGQLSSTALHL